MLVFQAAVPSLGPHLPLIRPVKFPQLWPDAHVGVGEVLSRFLVLDFVVFGNAFAAGLKLRWFS